MKKKKQYYLKAECKFFEDSPSFEAFITSTRSESSLREHLNKKTGFNVLELRVALPSDVIRSGYLTVSGWFVQWLPKEN